MSYVFLTGMMRSGTTLLQKSLNSHPEIDITYQSKTDVYINTLKEYYRSIGIDKYHVLSHYSPNLDTSFMGLQEWLRNNNSYEVYFEGESEYYSGVKEVLCEEFVPYFISNGIKCINIVRDPRDVICSMSFGNGGKYTGSERPVLFDIKNWRKSVLISEKYKESDYLLTVRMEDLLYNAPNTLSDIYRFLGVTDLPYVELIEIMKKNSWRSNSSFGDRDLFDTNAIGNYSENLPINVQRYIEATCLKEMTLMGYENSLEIDIDRDILNYIEPFEVKRKEFSSSYSTSEFNIEYEINRSRLDLNEVINMELGFK
ncbi:sulfotransferase [Vibrio splendidus]